MGLIPTSSQTVGPFFSIALERLCDENLAGVDVQGQRIVIEGSVVDGDGEPVPDALLEIWQADAAGNYVGAANGQNFSLRNSFRGFGRVATNERGTFRFATIKPGCVKETNGVECAPHILVSVFMRGLLTRLVTRVYFPDELKNADDPVLRLVPEERRGTLIAQASGDTGKFEWNIVLQGRNESVFFAC